MPLQDEFRLLFFNNPHPMWVYDLETLFFLEVNETAILQYGYTHQEFLAMRIADIRPPEDLTRLFSALEVGGARDPILSSGGWRHQYKNGQVIEVEITSHVLVFNNRPSALVVAQDVTERRRAEAAMLASEARFRAIFENSLDGIGIALDGKHAFVNPAYCRLFDYSESELIGSPIGTVLTAEQGRIVEDRARRRAQGEANLPELYESVGVRSDGMEVPIEIRASKYQMGDKVYTIAIMRDITERKQRESEALAAYKRELRIAQTLQKTLLLTHHETCSGIDFEVFYRASQSAEALVGGDFYDVFSVGKSRIALIVGDASGKGLAAAARTAEVKYVLRAFLRDGGDPADALTRLNRHLCNPEAVIEHDPTTFIALAIGVVDTDARTGTFAQAGAEPTLILRHDGRNDDTASPQAMGLPLGVERGANYGQTMCLLCRNDLVILTTDGITEARPPRITGSAGEFLGATGIAALARTALRDIGVEQTDLRGVGEAILQGATTFSGGLLRDDACFLIARLQ